jgi:aspartyl-tRNA(Asn)/glutamyl-tRNA(Gln) amidotransferase subunit A
MKPYHHWPALSHLAAAVNAGEKTARSQVERALSLAQKELLGSAICPSFVSLHGDLALAMADELDSKIARGEQGGDLAGIPFAVKDNIDWANLITSAGSPKAYSKRAVKTASVLQGLIDRGAIPIGKTNMNEWAVGLTGENAHFGDVFNPHLNGCLSGGSSSGSSRAVAMGIVPMALGSDTGGSIRMPASFCGISGLKPTYGLVSRWGLIAYASSFDGIGPMGHFVEDLDLVMNLMAGPDEQDSTVVAKSNQSTKFFRKIAYIKEIVEHPSLQAEIRKAFFMQVAQLEQAGYQVESVDFPYIDQMLPTYYVLTTAEASSNLSRFDGVKFGHRTENPHDLMDLYKKTRDEGFGEEVKRRIMLGTFVLSADYYDAYYTKAQKVRRLIQEKTDQILGGYDFIISPTTSSTAYALGEKTTDPLQMYLGDLFTVQANVTGLPAISVPMGSDEQDLPMGFQFMGPRFSESSLVEIAKLITHKF